MILPNVKLNQLKQRIHGHPEPLGKNILYLWNHNTINQLFIIYYIMY